MARGIRQHGSLKTFLTRGILGGLFRPILYSKVDKINYDFLVVITQTLKRINRRVLKSNKMVLQYWFSMAPLYHFELLFFPDEDNKTLIPMLEKAEVNSGKKCAYLTQAFILFNLEQIIKNSPEFREKKNYPLKILRRHAI